MSYKPTGRPVGRPKIFYEKDVPASVVKLVSAYCADLPRREKVISAKKADERLINVYRQINDRIFSALSDIEESLRGIFVSDIAGNRGYAQSEASEFMSYKAYYNRKKQIIYHIATELNLL